MKNVMKLLLVILIIIVIFSISIQKKILDNKPNNSKREEDIMESVNNVIVNINNKEYNLILENNQTVQAFINLLPVEFTMQELNGNEKYVYMNDVLPTNPRNVKNIQKGDVMLYENNCLVIFYKSFTTSYEYTKIGHIDNLEDLTQDNIAAKFVKK